LKALETSDVVKDLSPLKGLPLESLAIQGFPVKDLSPLEGMPLKLLSMKRTRVDDLTPLKGMPLKVLSIIDCSITDLSPLRGMPLTDLSLEGSAKLQDLTPLLDCHHLERLIIPATCKNIECLRLHPTLKYLGYTGYFGHNGVGPSPTVAEFWKAYDAAKTNAPAAKHSP